MDVVSIIAHDLKTPITSVKGYLELIERVGTLNERQQQFSQRALNSLKQMEQLITLLLEMSWIDADQPLKRDPCDLATLLREAANLLEDMAARHEVAIHVDIAPELGIILAESRRVEQVILNLLSNAIKYNRPGGDVWLTATGTATEVEFSIRDTGIGIPPEDLPFIFDRFFRARRPGGELIEGTGLGLSIARAIVEKHGGTIRLESSLGSGTTFFVTLPRQAVP